MDVATLERSLESSDPKPVYVVHGPEPFLRREAEALIRKASSQRGETDVRKLDAEELDARELIDNLRTPGLFAAKRLVIVDNADLLFKEAADLLLAYVKKPAANATLVLMASALDARRKGVKAIMHGAVSVECPMMRTGQLIGWCINRAQRHGKRLRPDAAKLLVASAGRNLGQLDGLISALTAYCAERPNIAAEDVSALAGADRARADWEIAQATVDRTPLEALRALHRVRREPRTSPGWVIASLSRRFRDMWRAKQLLGAKQSSQAVQQRPGKQNWAFASMLKTVKEFSESELRANCRRLLHADLECKTAGRTDWGIVERLILELCGVKSDTVQGSGVGSRRAGTR